MIKKLNCLCDRQQFDLELPLTQTSEAQQTKEPTNDFSMFIMEEDGDQDFIRTRFVA
jgi:hypothetical protein